MRYLSRCQSSDWLGECDPHGAVHVQRHCAGSWEAVKKKKVKVSKHFSHHCAYANDAKLTERHLVDEAEMTLHHLGLD